MRLAAAILAALAAALVIANAAGAAEQVELPHGDATLHGILYRPEGPGPFPAVVALHGCGGLVNNDGTVFRRFAAWGERLSANGLAVLFLDSYSTRGFTTQCRTRVLKVRPARERVADANAARRWLQQQDWVVKDRVSLVGWAEGGRASLWAVRASSAVRDGTPDFRTAVALYPGCRRLDTVAWAARVPTLILIGGADDMTPAATCERMVAGTRGRSARVSIVVYPGAHHQFDRPNSPVRMVSGLTITADGSGNAHIGTDPVARADAFKRVPEWLMR